MPEFRPAAPQVPGFPLTGIGYVMTVPAAGTGSLLRVPVGALMLLVMAAGMAQVADLEVAAEPRARPAFRREFAAGVAEPGGFLPAEGVAACPVGLLADLPRDLAGLVATPPA